MTLLASLNCHEVSGAGFDGYPGYTTKLQFNFVYILNWSTLTLNSGVGCHFVVLENGPRYC